MTHSTTVGVDLAKNVIQVSVISARGKELSNRSLSRCKFAEFLGKQKPALVAPFRQGHKTDSNDALAVAEAARRPSIKEAPMKTVEQQALQAIHRSRQLLIQESTALSNHLRGLLMELGAVIPQGFASLLRAVPEVLEDGENELPDLYRPTLHRMYMRLLELREHIEAMTKEVEVLVKQHPICSREFAAYLGLAPRQYSSGGKTNIVGLSKKIGNCRLRSILILGARAYASKQRPDIHSRLNSDQRNCLLNWRSPYTQQPVENCQIWVCCGIRLVTNYWLGLPWSWSHERNFAARLSAAL